MVSIATVLERLKDECKKDVTKTSSNIIDYDYNVVSIKLFGENYLMKKVSLASTSAYKVGWVLDNQTNSCMRCDVSFGLFHWRHHCRSCGYLICQRCGIKRLAIPELKDVELESRVCKGCFHNSDSRSRSNNHQQQNSITSSIHNTNFTTTLEREEKAKIISHADDEEFLSYDMIHSNTPPRHDNTKVITPVKDIATTIENVFNEDINVNNTNNNNSQSPILTSFDHTSRLYVSKIRLSIQDSGNPLLRSPKGLRRSSRGHGVDCLPSTATNATTITDPISSSSSSSSTSEIVTMMTSDLSMPRHHHDNHVAVVVAKDGVSLIHSDNDDDNEFKRPPTISLASESQSMNINQSLNQITTDIKPKRKSITAMPSPLTIIAPVESIITTVSDNSTVTSMTDTNSITSIDTKTAANTKLNAIITATVPLHSLIPEHVYIHQSPDSNTRALSKLTGA